MNNAVIVHIRGRAMNKEPAFYKMAEVEAKLNLHYQTIRRLIREGILIASGRGKGVLVSVRSVNALIDWMEQGGDKWTAPKMRNDHPGAPPVPAARAASGKMAKQGAGGTRSASTASSTSTERLTSKPPQRVLNSLRRSKSTG
jgi:hypothetical protein